MRHWFECWNYGDGRDGDGGNGDGDGDVDGDGDGDGDGHHACAWEDTGWCLGALLGNLETFI